MTPPAAVVARDLDRLESVTCQQEALSTRLAQAEAKRFDLLSGEPLSAAAAASEPVQQLSDSIAASVVQLKERQALTASLLEQSVQLAGETIEFLQRLVSSADSSSYSPRGRRPRRPSLLVDSRA
jgi:hypothetical protein